MRSGKYSATLVALGFAMLRWSNGITWLGISLEHARISAAICIINDKESAHVAWIPTQCYSERHADHEHIFWGIQKAL